MKNYKKEITICLGSSCFARGNKSTLKVINSYLKEYKLENKIFFHGSRCFGKCELGPILKIDDKFYEQVNEKTVLDILDENLKDI
ncbi:MAG: (2Fe-2S) ferredoxin domain-containing protein [Bacteroidales bacterium]|nr:(2Fe-2S) ferredoxin domain-containing protein [Bacteroidales bacterium]